MTNIFNDTNIWAELVYNNEYFKKYQEIILNEKNKALKSVSGITQKHHIIPKSYYKYKGLKTDNSSNNVVILYYEDHILAHYYLALCAKAGWFKYFTEYALMSMTREFTMPETLNELLAKMSNYQILYADFCKRQSEKASQRTGDLGTVSGKCCIYNAQLHKKKYIFPNEIDYYLANGWQLGGLPHTEEEKQKIGKSNSVALLGKKATKESNEKRSATLKERWRAPNNNWLRRKKREKESYKKVSESMSGRIAIKNTITGQRTRVKKDQLNDYLAHGWVIGWGTRSK